MKRKSDREAKEIFDEMTKNLPPLPSLSINLGQSNQIDTEMQVTDSKPVDEKSVPVIQDLPPPPLPGQLPLPPAPGELGLPPPPLLEKTVECAACGSSLKVKDMTLRRMTCPICSEIIEM